MNSHSHGSRARRVVALAFGLSMATSCYAIDLAVDDPALKDCLDRSLPKKAMTQKVTLKLFEGEELLNTSQAELFWKRGDDDKSKVIVRMTAPPERAGIAVLAVERGGQDPDLSVYMPETRKARKVAGRTIDASMFGTDFSYEDFAYFQGMATDSKVTRLEDQDIDGRGHYVVEILPGSSGSKYSKVMSYIDREQCMLTKIDFFAKNGTLLKDLAVPRADVKQVGERFVPHKVVLNDHKRGSRTELTVDALEIDPDLADNMFSQSRFGAGR